MSTIQYNILIVGLGSMGKRRIRNLQFLGYTNLYGFDVNPRRVDEAKNSYQIQIESNPNESIVNKKYDFVIISVPPDKHHIYIEICINNNINHFIEASVVDTYLSEAITELKSKKLICAPSATFAFHPAIKKIKELCDTNYLGQITNVNYQTGQYLPDWHTYENVSDFYVSNKETGGCREIVPFDMTWLFIIFGYPKAVVSTMKNIALIKGAEHIDETYNILFDYSKFVMNLTIDVISRVATRRLVITGFDKHLIWDWSNNEIIIYDGASAKYENISYELERPAHEGYDKNITEDMYKLELENFINAIEGKEDYISSLDKDYKILQILKTIEKSAHERKFIEIE